MCYSDAKAVTRPTGEITCIWCCNAQHCVRLVTNAKELDFGRALTLDQLAVYSQGAQGVALVDCTIGVLSRM